MTLSRKQITIAAMIVLALLALAAGGGWYWGRSDTLTGTLSGSTKDDQGREILYYYDPMFPQQKFDKPGKSPFMDMQLVPRYADEEGAATTPGVSIDPRVAQNLGFRSVAAMRGQIASALQLTGIIAYNERDIARIEARSAGFVEKVWPRAPGDVIARGSPLATLLVPEWAGAQAEYLALRRSGNQKYAQAAKARMQLLGMPASMIAEVERSGKTRSHYTISAPISGAIETLDVRRGMTLGAGQMLAQINGLSSVWLEIAVSESQSSAIHIGQHVQAELGAFPGQVFSGRVIAILPTADPQSRTLTARVELPNRKGQLRPGMFATVKMEQSGAPALLVPSEAIIPTGERMLVMLDSGDGRYRPAEVRIGREGGGQSEILAGLAEGEKVIVSGQFLIDSEASLSGIDIRRIDQAPAMAAPPAKTAPSAKQGKRP